LKETKIWMSSTKARITRKMPTIALRPAMGRLF
jgi:hypothetical protein